jgi:ATP adenylyltransferase
MDYILAKKEKGCLFCRKPKEKKDKENLILYRGKTAFIVMNRFPYNNGHLMVIPNRHCVDFDELNDEESQELCFLIRLSLRVLKEAFHPHGFNVGLNIGNAGGAGEPHLHLHVVPRWNGDTNFMPALGETKVIPEYLARTYEKLYPAFKGSGRKGEKREKGGRRR